MYNVPTNRSINISEIQLDGDGMPVALYPKIESPQSSDSAPAQLLGTDDGLFIVWKGNGNSNINFGQVSITWP
jgi:hypothetical protein